MSKEDEFPWQGKTHEDILTSVADDVLDYIMWYSENGSHVPEEFKDDPGEWVEILRQIEVACSILVVGPSMEVTHDRELEIARGIKLFNKYISHLWI
jgi:hypothetical protein